jgi:DNA-binding transcriptional LysR family regulator
MTAALKAPGTYAVTESDPAWEELLRDCQKLGTVVIQGQDGKPYRLEPQSLRAARPPAIAELPDFPARFRKLWPDGLALDESESSQLDKIIAGEQG